MAIKSIEVTPTIDTAVYTSGDHFGSLMELDILVKETDTATLKGVSITDIDARNTPIDILFFDETPTFVSSDNGVFDISDAELADKGIGVASIVGADYSQFANNSMASAEFNLNLKGTDLAGKQTKLYAQMVTRGGTPTYSTTTSLKLIFTFDTNR